MRVAFVVPAYQAERTIEGVVSALVRVSLELSLVTTPSVIVVDDGSLDRTAERASAAGALVVRHVENRGKGAALRSGLTRAHELSARAAVTVDADGQHPALEAQMLARHPAPADSLVLSVRDLAREGAPRANRFSNAFSNAWMSLFARRILRDTQCGLRRYPLPETLALGLVGTGFELETEVILKAVRRGLLVTEVPARVIYPPGDQRVSHFHAVRDPSRIVYRMLHTAWTTPWRRPAP